jgi:hypothetical protein
MAALFTFTLVEYGEAGLNAMPKEAISFIGLNDISEPMAARLLDNWYPAVSFA